MILYIATYVGTGMAAALLFILLTQWARRVRRIVRHMNARRRLSYQARLVLSQGRVRADRRRAAVPIALMSRPAGEPRAEARLGRLTDELETRKN